MRVKLKVIILIIDDLCFIVVNRVDFGMNVFFEGFYCKYINIYII